MTDQYDEIIWQMWAVWEGLRRLGFGPDDIYAVPHMIDPLTKTEGSGIALITQDKKFFIFAGPTDLPKMEVADQWQEFATKLSKGEFKQEELQKQYDKSDVKKNSVQFVAALKQFGFYFPADNN